MAGMFDQYEHVPQRTKNNSFSTDTIPGYIQMKLEEEVPIFSRTKMKFTPSDKITHVRIANKYMVIAMANSTLFRMDLQKPDEQDELFITKYTSNCRLSNLFLDPTGNHILISFAPIKKDAAPELVYLSRKSNKLKATTKFRGHEFTEIGWNYSNESENTTGPILLGTSKGLIFEAEIALEGDKFFTSGFSSGLEQYWRQLPNYLPLYGNKEVEGLVFDIGKGTNTPITGIEFHRIGTTDKYFIFIATPNRLYYFTGRTTPDEKPLLQQVFNKYLNTPEADTFIVVESSLWYSRLRFWSESLTVPSSFVWMTEKELTYAQFDPTKQEDMKAIKENLCKIEYPKPLYVDCSVPRKAPIACTLTEFHILLAYTDTIKAISVLNKEVVYEDYYNEAFGRLVNIVKDPITGTIWAITENAVMRFKVTKEERNVWQIYCEKKQFALAKKYSIDNPAYYNQVLIKEADMLFENEQYNLSAQTYAETQTSFEEVCLKFIQVDNHDALQIFLCKKLQTLKPVESTQTTMIVIWVIELYLNKLEKLSITGKELSRAYLDLQKEFQAFLAMPQVSDCIKSNKTTIYQLMASHGDKTNLIQLTILHKDFEHLIRQHIYKNSFFEALDVLKSQNNRELFYHFAPILIQEIPNQTVNALIHQGHNLKPVKLLPALVGCNTELHAKEVIKYLEYCVDRMKSTEIAIHNLLLSLYAKYDVKKLMEYLNVQGQDLGMVNYNVHFALRLCQEQNLMEACVQLSGLLGLWESAVNMALTINIDLAKQIANMPPECDVELRKKLWLKIAEHVVSGEDNIKQAMEFLKQCDLLRIEDILPFFSDFVTIDHFKEAICNSLNEYNENIQDLKDEMEEATRSAELVREELQTFRNRYTYIRKCDVCEICSLTLIIRPFYLFPCNHKFHGDCLLKELSPMLGPAKKNKLADLHRQLHILNTQIHPDNASTTSTGMSTRDSVKADIDNIVASECLYCGENMIRNIDMPFIDEKEYDRVMKEWA